MAGRDRVFNDLILAPGAQLPKGPPFMSNSGFLMSTLFWDRMAAQPVDKRVVKPIFALYEDRPGLINCQRTFVEIGDPTGYKWALKYLGCWEHFVRLKETAWFKIALDTWLDELKNKQLAEDLEVIRGLAKSDDKQALAAAKYLAGREWEKPKKGRPSKAMVEGELRRVVQGVAQEDEDFKRIQDRLNQVN